MNDFDLDADDLVTRTVNTAVSRQGRVDRCNRVLGKVAINGYSDDDANDLFRDLRAISLNQLPRDELPPPRKNAFTPLLTTNMPCLDSDETLTALQHLVDTDHAFYASNRDVTNDSGRWQLSLPSRPELNSPNISLKGSVSYHQENMNMSDVDQPPRGTTRSIEMQYDASNARGFMEGQKQRQRSPSDLGALIFLLARRIRKLEMQRFGHSELFTSKLLQQL